MKIVEEGQGEKKKIELEMEKDELWRKNREKPKRLQKNSQRNYYNNQRRNTSSEEIDKRYAIFYFYQLSS